MGRRIDDTERGVSTQEIATFLYDRNPPFSPWRRAADSTRGARPEARAT
jgi:hypothetical protein